MNKTIAIFLVMVAVAAGFTFLFLKRGDQSSASSFRLPSSKGFRRGIQMGDHVIKMTPEGFSPEEITIKKRGAVTWVNEDTDYRWPASNLHPTHEIYPEFDPREPVAPGETWSFAFDRAGEWRFHDHLRPRWRGIVRVEE